ncbi:MAG: hypothetical protein ABEL97_06870 [Salinibacter sp.]
MSRPLADPLYERLLDAFPATRPYTRADWDDEAMPDPVAHFLGQLMRHYSRREARRLRRARSKWVDYDHPEVETAVRTFFEAVEAHTRVPADEWEDTLRRATYHATAHLVRPVHELTDFVYARQEAELPLPEILWRMNFFGPYAYLREAVHAFAKKRDLDALGPEQFERFLSSIDERIAADYGADRWLRLLDPLFATARRATGREEMPVSRLRSFFAEKGRDDIDRRLRAYAEEGRQGVTPRALHRLIEDATTGAPADPSAAGPAPSSSDAPTAGDPAEFTPPPPSDDKEIWGVAGPARPDGSGEPQPSTDEDGDVPLWKRFQQGRTSGASSPADASGAEPSADAGEHRQEPLWARFRHDRDERLSDAVSDATADEEGRTAESRGESEPAPSSRTGSSSTDRDGELEALEQEVLGGVSSSHRSVYIQQLFGGDEINYRQVLRRLSRADSWGEASQLIAGDIFRAHKVNIYSDAAVHFTNAVEARFRE